MKKPTKEEVREYFKDAKAIKWLNTNIVYDITDDLIIKKHVIKDSYHVVLDGEINNNDYYFCVWSKFDGYAKIVKYEDVKQIPVIHEDIKLIEFRDIGESITSLLEYKNKKYGKSALNPINVFNGKTKVGQRLDDKISRVKNSDTLQKNDIADIIGYLFLVCKENGWSNFDEFKD